MLTYNEKEGARAKKILNDSVTLSSLYREKFSHKPRVGNCSMLFSKLQPKTPEEFFYKYITYATENKDKLPIKERGLTEEELIAISTEYMTEGNKALDFDYPFDLYLNTMIYHIITETFNGKQREMDVVNMLENMGYEGKINEGEDDSLYNMDISAYKEGKQQFAIQVKPISFFKSKKPDVEADQKKACEAYERAKRIHGITTYYMIYKANPDKSWFWLKNLNNKKTFLIDKIFDYDPANIRKTWRGAGVQLRKILEYNNMSTTHH